MINGFNEQTNPLNDDEMKLLSGFVKGLSSKIGKENSITNKDIRTKYQNIGIIIPDARVRKLINHIRIKGYVKNLCATSNGYYVARTKEEFEDYLKGLKDRIDSQMYVYQVLVKQYTENF